MNKLTLLLVAIVAAYVTAQCTKTTVVTSEGGACGGTTGATCLQELSCSSFTTAGTCKFQLQVGDACTTDTDCQNTYYNQFCSANKCAIRYKNTGASCAVAGECASNTCTSGTCAALAAGATCTATNGCGTVANTLFCTSNTTCAATAAAGAACGVSNGIFVQCVPGYYCVGSGTTGTCQAGVTEGATCASSATSTTQIWANPGCSTANAALSCLSSKCVAASSIAIGQPCGTTDILLAGKSCNARESVCSGNVCTAYSSINCNSNANCQGGFCNCQSDLTKNGTCTVNPYLTTSCASSLNRYLDCTSTVNTQNLLNTCGDKLKAYRCCLRNLNLVPNKDLTLAYCSSATIAQVSIVVMAVVAMISMTF